LSNLRNRRFRLEFKAYIYPYTCAAAAATCVAVLIWVFMLTEGLGWVVLRRKQRVLLFDYS
jgi:hypothetical protein